MLLHAGYVPATRPKKIARWVVVVGLALAALGSVAVSSPAANAGPVRLSAAEVLGVGLLAGGTVFVVVGLAVWVYAAATQARAAARDQAQPVNRWRAPAVPFGRR